MNADRAYGTERSKGWMAAGCGSQNTSFLFINDRLKNNRYSSRQSLCDAPFGAVAF